MRLTPEEAARRADTLKGILAGQATIKRRLFLWLLGDMFGCRWRRTLLVVAMSVLNVLVQMSSVGLVFVYIHQLERHRPLEILGQTIALEGTLVELLLASLAAGVLVAGSEMVAFLARKIIVREGISYYRRNLERGVEGLLAFARHPLAAAPYRPPDRVARSIFGGDIRYVAAAYVIILGSLLDIFTFAAASAALFWLSPWLGGLILVAFCLMGPLYIRFFNQGHAIQTELRQHARGNAKGKAELVSALGRNPVNDWAATGRLDRWMVQDSTADFLRLLARRQVVTDQAKVISALGGALATAIFIFFIGWTLVEGSGAFAGIATVLMVFRYLVRSADGLTSRAANLHANLPLFERFLALRELSRLLPALPGHGPAASGEQGTLAIFTPGAPGRFEAVRLAALLSGPGKEEDWSLVTSELTPFSWHWEQDLTGGAWELPREPADLGRRFPAFAGREESYRQLRERMEREPVTARAIRSIPRGLRFLFALQAALAKGQGTLFVSGEDFDALRPAEQEAVVELAGERQLVYLYTKVPAQSLPPGVAGIFLDRQSDLERIGAASLEVEQAALVERELALAREQAGDQEDLDLQLKDPEMFQGL